MIWERKRLKLWLGKRQKKKKNSNKRDQEQLKRIGEKGLNWSIKPLKIRKFWISIGQEELSNNQKDS